MTRFDGYVYPWDPEHTLVITEKANHRNIHEYYENRNKRELNIQRDLVINPIPLLPEEKKDYFP